MTEFHKMHGLGNDFIIVDERSRGNAPVPDAAVIAGLSDRHRGIGCDQFIVLRAHEQAACEMLIFNADGSKAGACGNATRCVAALVADGWADTLSIAVGDKRLACTISEQQGDIGVNMGRPTLNWRAIPLRHEVDCLHVPHNVAGLDAGVAVNMGNPHLVLFVEGVHQQPLHQFGPELERAALFPERANINIAHITDRQTIHMRTWERGAGLTHACGSGACAVMVAARLRGLVEAKARCHLPGGTLDMAWDGHADDTEHDVMMCGAARYVFRGTLPDGVWA